MKTMATRYPRLLPVYFIMGVALLFCACKGKQGSDDDEDKKAASLTPVTITTIDSSRMEDYADLNATSVTLQKNYVKSNANGYVQQVNAQLGQNVSRGEVLFVVKTKQSQAIGNSIN